MSTDGLHIDEQTVMELAERLPVKHGDAARRHVTGLPTGRIFGNSPAATSLTETWRLAVEHHRQVAERLEEDLVNLRQALIKVVDNTAALEADSTARFQRATQEFAVLAESTADDLETSTETFVAGNESEVARELVEQHEAAQESTTGPMDDASTAPTETASEDAAPTDTAADEPGPSQALD